MIDKTKFVRMNLSILGIYIRVARLNEGISLRQLASKTNISHTLISNIEMGKQIPSEETLKDIMSALHIKLNLSEDISESMSYYYKKIFNNLINYKYSVAKKYVEDLEKDSERYINSLEVINYHIIRSLYYALTKSSYDFDEIKVYEEVINFLSLEQQQLIFYIKGLIYLGEFHFFEAEKCLIKANEIQKNEINVLINESLVTAYIYQFKFTNSVSLCNQVIEEFESRSNYIRAMHCRLLIARVYSKIMKFDLVMNLVDRVSQFAHQFDIQYLLDDCHVIKAGVHFYWEDYGKAIYELDQVADTTVDRYAYTRFRIYLVSKDDRLANYYKKITSDSYLPLSNSTKLLVKILMKWQNKDYRDEAYVSEIEKLKDLAVKGNDQELIGLTYNLLISYYKEDRKYKRALEISEELLMHKKIHIKFYSIKPSTI